MCQCFFIFWVGKAKEEVQRRREVLPLSAPPYFLYFPIQGGAVEANRWTERASPGTAIWCLSWPHEWASPGGKDSTWNVQSTLKQFLYILWVMCCTLKVNICLSFDHVHIACILCTHFFISEFYFLSIMFVQPYIFWHFQECKESMTIAQDSPTDEHVLQLLEGLNFTHPSRCQMRFFNGSAFELCCLWRFPLQLMEQTTGTLGNGCASSRRHAVPHWSWCCAKIPAWSLLERASEGQMNPLGGPPC